MDGVYVTDQYHPGAGFVYVFNLIVGTGALTMPKAFCEAGWLLSLIVIIMLSVMSFVTVTFVIESMSLANAVIKTKRRFNTTTQAKVDEDVDNVSETSRLLDNSSEDASLSDNISRTSSRNSSKLMLFDITHRIELGAMAKMFLPSLGVKFFYTAIAVYLYGDLVIYAAAISKSVRDVSCSVELPCDVENIPGNYSCWKSESVDLSRTFAYRIFVVAVLVLLGPLAYFDVSKTKYIQILTTIFRWVSFTCMIILAGIALGEGKGQGKPKIMKIGGLPNLFGVAVYSFMCHHSLPSLVTPMSRKKNIYWLLFADYGLILSFYLLLSFTGSYTFQKLKDIYTLNFQQQKCSSGSSEVIHPVPFLQYFLPLFPVVTLSTSFPIIAITLTYNLKTFLMHPMLTKLGIHPRQESYSLGSSESVVTTGSSTPASNSRKLFLVERIFFPSLAVIPPVLLALVTEDLQMVVGIVGSYAGACIQYVIPALLVYFARKQESTRIEELPLDELKTKVQMASPFRSRYWVPFVLLWAVVSMILVTINHIIAKVSSKGDDKNNLQTNLTSIHY